ncbi:BZ3500_MvSof-1268-A1-R1_Chr4-2g06929 [Microbotryum saponariae]|uniref:BZ3500_MvSof-1268-A1-R1_Chr4-2g06929 protein n=1 Tax=Microbotryum saponariae TaxID=289078 RepID=A0A2X0LHP8_9BASI|nr:BZ3500_MvSof-1268-A1-R1_Chr4-2g06929 [Microbotryum saponariae]SDA06594.1 BZ3501_MvSof-1269-A2-R1_Chr4-2g06640 [Microbotryum saponariae]
MSIHPLAHGVSPVALSKHAKQPLRLMTPFSLATPAFPALDRRIAPYSKWLLPYRALRLLWVVLLIPIHVLLCILVALGCPIESVVPTGLYPVTHKHSWTLLQSIFYPILKRLIWSITDVGGAPRFSDDEARTIPRWTVWLLRVVYPGSERVVVHVEDAEPSNEGALGLDVELVDASTSIYYRGEAYDPSGVILPSSVPLFWFEQPRQEQKSHVAGRRAGPRERVVLYFVGGGYSYGSPIEGNRCYTIAQKTGLRVVGANYRKAVRPETAFPAALQDAITAYKHLLDLGFKDIVLAGDSAGGGLAITLLLYFCKTLVRSPSYPASFILPTGMFLYSPWVDLTLRNHRKLHTRLADDILSQGQMSNAATCYLVNTVEKGKSEDPNSIYNLGARHPFISPALPSSLPTLEYIGKAYAHRAELRILIFSGQFSRLISGAEYFAPDIHALVWLLRKVKHGMKLTAVEEKNEVHCYPLMPLWVSPAAERALQMVEAFLLDKAS